MKDLLQKDLEERDEILTRTLALARQYFARQAQLPPGRYIPDQSFDALPERGEGALETLSHFESRYAHLVASTAGPRYFGFVTGGSTPASVAGDWLVSVYDQNACGSNDSIAPHLERQTIHYFRQLFGLSSDFYGAFVTGATMSNFVGLSLGRQWIGERLGIDVAKEGLSKVPVKVISGSPHSSIFKSLSMLGIGRRALVRIDTRPDREAVDLQKLEACLAEQTGPVIVVANAGTVNTGDFDDLTAIAELKNHYPFWLHVDAAFGGFAACSEKFGHLMNGVNSADSLTVDAHKWLNVPYDAAMQFTRHPELQRKVFQNSAAYLTDPAASRDYFHFTPESSRRWRALPSWFTLRAYGRDGYREIVDRNCREARRLGEMIERSGEFKLLSPVRLNIVCFTLDGNPDFKRVQSFLQEVRDGGKVFFTPTVYRGAAAIRAAISNWQTTAADIDTAFTVLTEVYARQHNLKSRVSGV